jgi:hypothetical protein
MSVASFESSLEYVWPPALPPGPRSFIVVSYVRSSESVIRLHFASPTARSAIMEALLDETSAVLSNQAPCCTSIHVDSQSPRPEVLEISLTCSPMQGTHSFSTNCHMTASAMAFPCARCSSVGVRLGFVSQLCSACWLFSTKELHRPTMIIAGLESCISPCVI